MSCAPNELCGDCPDREACHEATECLHGDRPTTADVAAELPITPRELARAMFMARLSDPNGDEAERAWMEAGGDRGALDYDAAMVLQQLRSGQEG